jgi:CRP/FNR family transcriptional regulator, cyclic AMP receptor protein
MSMASQRDEIAARTKFFSQLPLFADLKKTELEAVVKDFRLREYSKGEIIFRQEDYSQTLYVVFKGKVRIFKVSPSGNETSINVFSPGGVIGEFAPLDLQPRSATAKALEPCALWEISGSKFLRHLRDLPDLSLALIRLLIAKVRWTADYAETIAQYDAAGRLLHILLLYNEQFGDELEAGKKYVLDLALTQGDLASLVGARREWINRILQEWRRRGLIEYQEGKIIIHDLAEVRKERDLRLEAERGQ